MMEYQVIFKGLMVDVLEKEEDFITFTELIGMDWEEKWRHRKKCLYVLAIFKKPIVSYSIPVLLLPRPVETKMGPLIGFTVPEKTPSVEVLWREIGRAQMNIVDDKGLVWECYIYTIEEKWEELLPIALDWVEEFLRKKGVRTVFFNPYEPAYEGREGFFGRKEGPKPEGWWSEYLKKRGYREHPEYRAFNRPVLVKTIR